MWHGKTQQEILTLGKLWHYYLVAGLRAAVIYGSDVEFDWQASISPGRWEYLAQRRQNPWLVLLFEDLPEPGRSESCGACDTSYAKPGSLRIASTVAVGSNPIRNRMEIALGLTYVAIDAHNIRVMSL
ncbi:hypothetical protein H9L39_18210 [Fusarium oxysporum f. sp. albedinis]|nr:hypothetical protein H9L39_18210 [Fusarium oxysporum f. sp. albedinis]